MNENLPKSMLNALAGLPVPADHPSADALTAYMEHGLTELEQSSVADHLARCVECRETVFVASLAGEETRYLDMVAAAAPAQPRPRARWMRRLLWVGSIAAGLLVAGYFVRDRFATPPREAIVASNQATQSSAQPLQPSPESTSQIQARPEAAQLPANVPSRQGVTPKKAARATAVPAAPSDVLNETAAQAKVATSEITSKSDATLAQAPTAAPQPAMIAIGGTVPSKPMSPHISSFAPSANIKTEQETGGASSRLYLSRALPGPLVSDHQGWRVNSEGHLEHQTEDVWSRVLAEQTVVFRVVYARGNEVWAGGDGGALFHSSDGGQQWTKVALAGVNGPENGTITAIRFSTPQQGIVITTAPMTYATSDGGATWTRK